MKRKILTGAALALAMAFPSIGMCADTPTVTTTVVKTEQQTVAANNEDTVALVQDNVVEAPVAEVKGVETPKSAEPRVVENEAGVPTFQRIQLTEKNLDSRELAETAGNTEAIVELLKKKAVAIIIEGLKNPNFDYKSDFSDLIANYGEYIAAVNVAEKDSAGAKMLGAEVVGVKVDVRSAVLRDIVNSNRMPKKIEPPKVVAAPQSADKSPATQAQKGEIESQPSNDNIAARPSGRDTVSTEQGERRHKWAMGYNV